MSASELKLRCEAAFLAKIDTAAQIALAIRRQPGSKANAGLSIEDYALTVIEANAYRRGLDDALAVLIEEHQKLVAPDTLPGVGADKEDDKVESIY